MLAATRKERAKPHAIALHTRIKARNLYCLQRFATDVVAKECGLTVKQVRNLAHRENWYAERRAVLEKVEAKLRASDAKFADEIVDAHAKESAELSLGALAAVREALADTTTNEFGEKLKFRYMSSAAKAARDIVTIYRDASGLTQRAAINVNVGVNSFAAPKQTLPEPTEIEVRSSSQG